MPDKKLTAKERKQRAAEKSRAAVKKAKGRRSGRVTTYVSEKAKVKPKEKRKIHPAHIPVMRTPKAQLSAEARFAELRPDCVHPWDWAELFTPDEDIWQEIVEEATEAVAVGEVRAYPDDGPANESRRKLRKLRGEL